MGILFTFEFIIYNPTVVLIGTIFTIICPLIFGYFINEFLNQKSAINEFCQIIIELWSEAEKIEIKSQDKEYFENIQPINWGMYYNQNYFKKEIYSLYIFGIYFNSLKWYNHELFYLPKEFKEKIKGISNICLEIDLQMAEHKNLNSISMRKSFFKVKQYNFLKSYNRCWQNLLVFNH